MLKAGVAGAGHLGKIHLKLLQESNQYELMGFYDADPKQAAEFETKHVNIWRNAADALINIASWDACADSSLQEIRVATDQIDASELGQAVAAGIQGREDLAGATVRLGGDLAGFRDIASLVLEFDLGHKVVWLDFHFLPREQVE